MVKNKNQFVKNKKHTHFELAAILLLEWGNKSYLQTNYLSLPCQQQPYRTTINTSLLANELLNVVFETYLLITVY